jgi:phage I-like protein
MAQTLITAFEIEQDGAWLHICPAGPLIVARDGRAFQLTDAAAVVRRTELPLLLDWEHDSERWDGSTAAAGWGEALEVRASGIWLRTAYTPQGTADVASKRYRYLSPVLELDAESRDVLSIVSVALTNKPALRMSQIGNLVDFQREQLDRIACSMAECSDLAPKERRKLNARGITDAEIHAAEQYNRDRRAALAAEPVNPNDNSDAAVRARCLARGMTPERYEAATRFQAQQAARHRRCVMHDLGDDHDVKAGRFSAGRTRTRLASAFPRSAGPTRR